MHPIPDKARSAKVESGFASDRALKIWRRMISSPNRSHFGGSRARSNPTQRSFMADISKMEVAESSNRLLNSAEPADCPVLLRRPPERMAALDLMGWHRPAQRPARRTRAAGRDKISIRPAG